MKTFLFLFLLIPYSVQSQTVSTDKLIPEKPYIEVVGTATKEVKPDKIVVSIILSEKDNDNNQNSIDKQDDNLKKILSAMSITTSKLFLSDASAEIIKEKRRDQTVKRSKDYNLELQSAEQVSTFLQKLSDAGIKEAIITSVDHSKIDSLRKEVRIDAIKAAKEKAVYLTIAIGEQIDKALEIREQYQNALYPPLSQFNNLSFSQESLSEDESNFSKVDFRLMKISFSFFIKYSLK